MNTDDNRDKLKLIKRYFIFSMLQQPSCYINVNKTVKKASANIKQKNRSTNNFSTEFTPPIQEEISENDFESMIPICDKSSMTKLLVTLKLLKQPHYKENNNEDYLDSSIPNQPIIIEEDDIANVPIE